MCLNRYSFSMWRSSFLSFLFDVLLVGLELNGSMKGDDYVLIMNFGFKLTTLGRGNPCFSRVELLCE